MQWVHMSCLDTWRTTSSNPRSFYECDQCKFKYHLGSSERKFFWARLLSTSYAIEGLAFLGLLCTVFVGGFIGKALDANMDWADVIRCFNVHHLLCGATTTGLVSLVGGFATTIGGGVGLHVVGDAWRGQQRSDVVGTLILVFAVCAGLWYAFSWLYQKLEANAARMARMAQSVVLDVQGDLMDANMPSRTSNRAPQYTPVD